MKKRNYFDETNWKERYDQLVKKAENGSLSNVEGEELKALHFVLYGKQK